MTNTVKSPARLELRDLPQDKTRSLGQLPRVLMQVFNYTRRYPLKLEALKMLLKTAHAKVVEYQKADEAFKAFTAKRAAERAETAAEADKG